MINLRGSLGRWSRWMFLSLLLVGSSTAAGCGNPGEGSVAVSSEARARILPHVNPNAKKTKNAEAQPASSQPLSAKQLVRQKAATGSE